MGGHLVLGPRSGMKDEFNFLSPQRIKLHHQLYRILILNRARDVAKSFLGLAAMRS